MNKFLLLVVGCIANISLLQASTNEFEFFEENERGRNVVCCADSRILFSIKEIPSDSETRFFYNAAVYKDYDYENDRSKHEAVGTLSFAYYIQSDKQFPETLYITNLEIFSEYQNKGFGKAALRFLIDMTSEGFLSDLEFKEYRLNVITSNERAYNLYKKLGFEEAGFTDDQKENHYMVLKRP